MGKDIGYLPGTKDEKLSLWMQPIFDNLTYLMRMNHKFDEGTVQQKVTQLLKNQQVELEALTYIRGRSIPNQFVIVDEAQNLTPHEVKTIICRAGEGTKMVLTGDPDQIDNPYLDSSSNGLSYAVEKLKGQALYGHVTLEQERKKPAVGDCRRVFIAFFAAAGYLCLSEKTTPDRHAVNRTVPCAVEPHPEPPQIIERCARLSLMNCPRWRGTI